MLLSDDQILELNLRTTSLIESPHEVVTFSAIVHQGVDYLDLDVYSGCRLKRATTDSTFQLLVLKGKEGPISYGTVGHLNLDSPQHFDGKLQMTDYEALYPHIIHFFVDSVHVAPSVYTRNFDLYIVERMEKSQNKLSDLKKYLKAIKTMGFFRCGFQVELYVCLQNVLLEERCEDPGAWTEFLKLCGHNMAHGLLSVYQDESRSDDVLSRIQRWGFDIFKEESSYPSPVHRSVVAGLAENVQILLKHGFPTDFHFESQNVIHGLQLHFCTTIEKTFPSPLSHESSFRLILLFQVASFYNYYHSDDNSDRQATVADSMRMLWRSLPSCFLDRQEMTQNYRSRDVDHFEDFETYVELLWEFYECVLGAEPDFRRRGPRSLVHLCRCGVRSALGRNRALPGGVDSVGLPEDLVPYLKLER